MSWYVSAERLLYPLDILVPNVPTMAPLSMALANCPVCIASCLGAKWRRRLRIPKNIQGPTLPDTNCEVRRPTCQGAAPQSRVRSAPTRRGGWRTQTDPFSPEVDRSGPKPWKMKGTQALSPVKSLTEPCSEHSKTYRCLSSFNPGRSLIFSILGKPKIPTL